MSSVYDGGAVLMMEITNIIRNNISEIRHSICWHIKRNLKTQISDKHSYNTVLSSKQV